jgi:hypothetical protein
VLALLFLLVIPAGFAADAPPPLLFSTFTGGSKLEFAGQVAFAPDGTILVCGSTESADHQWIPNAAPKAVDAFVAKLTADGSHIVWARFLGGSGLEDTLGLAVDPLGNVFVDGRTDSRDFPVTADAYQKSFGGGIYDAYLAKLNPDGEIVYATYFGGSGGDAPDGLAVDSGGNAVISGDTSSGDDFPLFHSLQKTNVGGTDIFIVRFTADNRLSYSTMLGSSSSDAGHDLAVDSDGNAWFIGLARGGDFPTVHALQPAYGGTTDAVVVKVAPDGTVLLSTFFGGPGFEGGDAIAAASDGIWIAGRTDSGDFLTNPKRPFSGRLEIFLAKLSKDGQSILASTYLGGSQNDAPLNMTVMTDGSPALCAETSSSDYPLRRPTQGDYRGGSQDGVVTVLARDASSILFSTFIGGTGFEQCTSIARNANNVLAFTGPTTSVDFPVANAVQPASIGVMDDYVVAVDLGKLLTPARRRAAGR